jgi:hypothetical protein
VAPPPPRDGADEPPAQEREGRRHRVSAGGVGAVLREGTVRGRAPRLVDVQSGAITGATNAADAAGLDPFSVEQARPHSTGAEPPLRRAEVGGLEGRSDVGRGFVAHSQRFESYNPPRNTMSFELPGPEQLAGLQQGGAMKKVERMSWGSR